MPGKQKYMAALAAFFISLSPITVLASDHQEVQCMATAIHYEARGEPLEGRRAVANVLINRKNSDKFPDTICKVIKQKGQFAFWPKPLISDKKKLDEARHFLSDKVDNTRKSLFFHNSKERPNWKKKFTIRIGNHLFYR